MAKKLITILISIILLTTFVQSVMSQRLDVSSDNSTHIKEKLDNKIGSTQEKILNNIGEKSKSIKEKIKSFDFSKKISERLDNHKGLLSFYFFTNYSGKTKETKLNLFRETKIDINNDLEEDISVRFRILPGFERPVSICLKFILKIKTLEGFENLDKKAYFENYLEFYYMGLLVKNLTDSRLRFGYESPSNEKIPKDIELTYKFVPHIFSLMKKPIHKFLIKTDSENNGDEKLNLIFSFFNEKENTELLSKVKYNPAVNSEIIFTRGKIDGVSVFEYSRSSSENTDVDLYLKHTNSENTTYAYVLDMPDKISISSKIGRQGFIEFNTHDNEIQEIGLCDSLDFPKNKVYFSNLFTKAKIEWNKDPLFLFRKGVFNASLYTKGQGVEFNVHLEGDCGGIVDFFIKPDASIIDASLELDLSEGYFRLNRNEFDLFVSFYISVLNESMSSFLSTLEGSFNIARLSNSPFEIFFDDLFDGDVEIYLSGKSFELYDLEITGFSEKIGGNFSVLMDRFFKQTNGFVSITVSTEIEENNITGICFVEIDHGAEIKNLNLKFNNFVFARDSINTTLSITKEYSFSICVSIVEWDVSDDLSNGTIVVKGNSSAMFSFNSTYVDENEMVGRISGTIQLKTTSELFNISWETIDGNLSLNIDGGGLVSLSDFNLWVKDKVEISIPEISVNFQLNTSGKDGKLMIYLDDNYFSANFDIKNINITELFDITLKGSINAVLDAAASGTIDISWNESGVTGIEGDFQADATGIINITNFEFNYRGLVDISADRLLVNGGLNVDFTSISNNISINANVDLTNIIINKLRIYSSISSPLGVSADMNITFDGSGYIDIVYSDDDLILNGNVNGDSDITINTLWFLVPGLEIEVNLEALYIQNSILVKFTFDQSKDIPIMVNLFSESEITAETIYLGYPGVLQIFMYDFVGGGPESGSIGVGLNSVTTQPVFDLNHSCMYVGELQFWVVGNLFPISNVSFEGSLCIEGFLDIALFSYVYLKGEIIEDTKISFKNMNVTIVLKPGNIDLLFENGLTGLEGGIYVYGYSSSWIEIKKDGKNLVELLGTLDLWVDLHQSSDGTFSVIIDAKEASGAIILLDNLRVAGELNALIDFSININKTEDTTTISDLNVNVSGEISAIVQIKSNETDWIPVPVVPYSSTGQLVLLRQSSGFMQKPNIIDDFVVTTPLDNMNLSFEVWYAPPLLENSTTIGPYSYNVSFGDGTFYEITTDKNRIITNSHQYTLGEYLVSATVTPADSSVPSLNDDLSFEIIKKPVYFEIVDTGPLAFTYDDVETDGRIHTWFEIKNVAEESYNLDWEASFSPLGFDSAGMDVIFEPSFGSINTDKKVRINVSFYPPTDHKKHINALYFTLSHTNYEGYGEDYKNIVGSIRQSFSLFPSEIFLPDLNPGEEITSSIWIHNNKDGSFNWSITDYPNEYYVFSSTSGEIPKGGAEIVHFTINAPFEDEIDLGGEIKVIDVDDPVNLATSYVNINSKSESSSDNNVTVTEDENGNVSIAIGGSNEIHLNNFQTNINGVLGEINGHFVFDTNKSYVYINFTKGDFSNFSIEGSAEFSVNNFRFRYGDSIFVEVSKIISGGMHFKKGRSGNLSISVDDTFTDIGINISVDFDEYTNFSVNGNFDIDVDSEMNGDIWLEWDFNEGISQKNLTIGGDLLGYKNVNINITDFEIEINNFYLYVEKIFFNKTIDILVNKTGLHIESENTFELGDIQVDFEFEGLEWDIFSINNAEFILDGSITFSFSVEEELFCMIIDGYFEIHATVLGNIDGMSFQVSLNLIMDGFWRVCGGTT